MKTKRQFSKDGLKEVGFNVLLGLLILVVVVALGFLCVLCSKWPPLIPIILISPFLVCFAHCAFDMIFPKVESPDNGDDKE